MFTSRGSCSSSWCNMGLHVSKIARDNPYAFARQNEDSVTVRKLSMKEITNLQEKIRDLKREGYTGHVYGEFSAITDTPRRHFKKRFLVK